jgi:hypothetical protein
MRHIKLGESTVMQEFERIAAEKGWITENTKTAEEHVPLGLVKEPHMTQHWQYPTSSELGKTPSPAAMPAGTLEPTSYQGSVIQQVQKTLEEAGEDLGPKGPDGIWGWFTSRAWNAFAKKYPQAGLPQTTEHQPPANALMRKMLGATPAPTAGKTQMPSDRPPLHLIKEPHMTQPHQYPTIKELVPKASIAIVDELIALANDLDAMGETKTANAVDRELVLYKEAVDKLYDITGETGEQLIGEAHPGGGPTMAPAKEEGGKVETIVEEQKKDLKVVQKQPTGKQAAFVAKRLVALANRLDAEGKMEAALLVDKTLAELREGPQRPFVVTGRKISKQSQVGIKTILQQMITALSQLEDTVQDMGPFWVPKQFALTYGGNLYKLKYDKFLVAAQKDLQKFADLPTVELESLSLIVDDINAGLAKVKSFYSTDPNVFSGMVGFVHGEWNPQGETLWNKAYQTFQTFVKSTPVSEAVKAKTKSMSKSNKPDAPAPAAVRKEQPREKQLQEIMQKSYNRFKGTVNRLLDGLVKTLQDPVKEAEANRMLKGKLNEMIDWLKTLYQQKEPTTLAERNMINNYNNILYNSYLRPLSRNPKLANVFASTKDKRLVKEAAPPIKSVVSRIPGDPVGLSDQPTPTKKTDSVKPIGKRLVRRPVEKRDDIGQLQQMLVALDMGPVSKSGKIDSTWGKYTATAWQKLNTRVKGKLGTFGPQNAPPPEAVRKAIQIANVIQRFSQGIDIAQGITLPVSAFTSVQAFMRALATRRAAGIDTSGNVDTAVNRKRALELLRGFSGRMEDEDIYVNLVTKLGEQGAQRFSQQVDSLLDALSAADAGIPGSYRMPGGGASGQPGQPGQPGYSERQPYSRSGEGGEGMGGMGTLESRPGGRGGAGAGSYSSTRRTRMSLEDRVYNIPDVSGFVNDPAQFTAWAQRYLKFARKPVPREPYAAAYAALELLRGQVADLQIETMTAAVNNREDLQDTLRQRHEAVNDVYNVLPKGR